MYILTCRAIIHDKKWYYTEEMEACQHFLARVVIVTQRTPASAYSAVAVSRDHAGLQRRGRLSRPHRVTTRRTICPFALAYNATDDSPVRPCGRFTCLRQLTTPWPTRCPRRLTKVTADSPVHTGLPCRGRFTRERLQLHLAIINFMADYFRPGTSGDIHLKYILLVHIILSKSSLSLSRFAILLMQDNCSLHQNGVVSSPDCAGL